MGRHVGHELGGEHLARLEHRGVEQRLEDAAGAAGRRDDVHVLAVLLRPGRPVVADVGQHLAGLDVEDERGRVADAVLGQGALVPPEDLVHALLDRLAQGRAHPGARVARAEAPRLPLRPHARHQVGGEHGQPLRGGRQRLALAELRGHRVDRAPVPQGVEEAVALRQEPVAVAAGVHEGGGVRQHGERRRLRPRELPGVAAEVAPGRRVEAHRVAPEGRVRGVEAEHLPLRERQREPQRERGLDRLLDERARPALAREAHDLHGERAAAAHHAAPAEVEHRRAGEGQRVHPGVRGRTAGPRSR